MVWLVSHELSDAHPDSDIGNVTPQSSYHRTTAHPTASDMRVLRQQRHIPSSLSYCTQRIYFRSYLLGRPLVTMAGYMFTKLRPRTGDLTTMVRAMNSDTLVGCFRRAETPANKVTPFIRGTITPINLKY